MATLDEPIIMKCGIVRARLPDYRLISIGYRCLAFLIEAAEIGQMAFMLGCLYFVAAEPSAWKLRPLIEVAHSVTCNYNRNYREKTPVAQKTWRLQDYTVVKKTSSDRCQDPVSEGCERPLSPITGPPPHQLIHEDINHQKNLDLIYKMIELLIGEVPIRCQDVAVYFSMEEWEYLEGHSDLHKNVIMEVPQPFTSPDLSSKRTTPERCPRPLLPQDCNQEDPSAPQDHQVDGEKVSGDLPYDV
ncbi:uncharacterized protein [Dendrobates tinctorius]|uniref:uncharacterized protein n=1 Tax=Dendrobates tinctorius TaxID=92724 RepID=UPI003CC9BDFB